jgi:hypothetical protein
VPSRALNNPLLLYGILAFASQHLELTRVSDQSESARYYTQALCLLISQLDLSTGFVDESVLCGIVLLRLYEERSGRPCGKDITLGLAPEELDEGTHLLHSSRVLSNFNSPGPGGLAEACFWLVLRQDMLVALRQHTPPNTPFGNIFPSRAFTESDAEAVANRILYICSKILSHVFDPLRNTHAERWYHLDAQVDTWYSTKPWHFKPLWMEESSHGPDAATAFPTVRLASHAYVAGLQHYHLAKMLLAMFDPRLSSNNGPDVVWRRQCADSFALSHLRMLIGISISNPQSVSSRLTACHCIESWGSCLRDPREHAEVANFMADTARL